MVEKMLKCILLVAMAATAAATCDKYTCKPKSMDWKSDTCGYYDSNEMTWYFKDTCGDGEVCRWGGIHANYTCGPSFPDRPDVFPGDKCNGNLSCALNRHCTPGDICPGRALNESCFSYIDPCAPKLYCPDYFAPNAGICQPMKPFGFTCETDNECEINMLCYYGNTTTPATTGVCIPLASLPPYTYIDQQHFDHISNFSYFCENLAAFRTGPGANDIRCAEPVTMVRNNPVYCREGDDDACASNPVLGGIVVKTSCTCGQNPTRDAFCALHNNDPVRQKAINLYKSWISSSTYINKCSGLERGYISTCAMNYWEDYDEFNYYFTRSRLYPKIINISPCVLKTAQYEYYDIKEKYKLEEDIVAEE